MLPLKKLTTTLVALFFISFTVKAVDEIVITFNQTQICAGSSISVPFTTTFPANTSHKIQLLKNGTEVAFFVSTLNPISLSIPSSAIYATDYELKILANGVESLPKIVAVLNPTVTQESIFTGLSGVLTATGCGSANVLWQDASDINNPLFTSNPYNTPILTGPTTYNVKCAITNGCQTAPKTYVVQLTEPVITITDYPKNLCNGTSASIDVSSNLPSNSGFIVSLIKLGIQPIIVGAGQIVNGKINFTTFGVGSGYSFQVSYLDIKSTITNNDVVIGSFEQTIFIDKFNGQYLGYPRFYCTGSEAIIEAAVVKQGDKYYYEDISNVQYQWQKEGQNFGAAGHIAEITTAGVYNLVATIGSCISTSPNVNVQFDNTNNIQIFPNEIIFCEDQNLKLSTNYNTTSATYQWKLDGVDIPGATENNLITNQTGDYTVTINDKACLFNSNAKKLDFKDALLVRINAFEKTLCGGSGVNLYIISNYSQIYNNLYNVDISWQKDGVNIPGKDTRGIWVYEPGIYRCKIIQGNCVSYSQDYEVVTGSQWDKPKINQPINTNLNICSGSIGIYWSTWGTVYKDGNIVAPFEASYLTSDAGTYKLVREPGNPCSSESEPIVISLGSLNPIILASATSVCGTEDYASIYFDTSGLLNSSYAFQWEKDGTILGGNQSLFATNIPGTYKVRVSNGSCQQYSNEITITRNDNLTFDLKPLSGVSLETTQNLECSNRLSEIYLDRFNYNHNVKWYRNGEEIINNNNQFLLTPKAGTYTVSANFNGCTATSNPFIVNSDYVPQPNLGQSITYMNTSAALEATGCNGTINWYDSQTSTTSLGTGFTFNTPNLTSTTPYFADCTTATCKSAREKIDVIVEPCNLMVTVKSGGWNDPTVWSCNRVPYDLESVTIAANHSILIPNNYNAKVKEIINNGGIIIESNAILQMKTN